LVTSNAPIAIGGPSAIPFTIQRTGIGQVMIHFDPALVSQEVMASSDYGPVVPWNLGPGAFGLNCYTMASALTDAATVSFTATVRRMGA
jgi:hypothetical protein